VKESLQGPLRNGLLCVESPVLAQQHTAID